MRGTTRSAALDTRLIVACVQSTDARTQAETDPVAEVAQDLLVLWKAVMRASGPQAFHIIEDLNLTLSHVKALHALDDGGELSVKDLAVPLALSLPATSRLV